jgi:hypothetical protein
VRRTLWKRKGDFGFNARAEEFESLDDAGVIDPAKVVRSARKTRLARSIVADNHRDDGRRKTQEARSHARGCPLVPAWEE